MPLLIEEAQKKLARWEAYRTEMLNQEQQMAKLAGSFLELGAYQDSAICAIKAEGLKYIIGRMPEKN